MQEITKKITDDAIKSFTPMIEQMALEGCSKDEIVRAFGNHVRAKQAELCRKPDFVPLIAQIKTVMESAADSRPEVVLIRLLERNKIKCIFHRKIGPYTADFLINDRLIVELDGPHHNRVKDERRDKYLRKMGYEIIRIPLWALSINAEAIITEIKEASGGGA